MEERLKDFSISIGSRTFTTQTLYSSWKFSYKMNTKVFSLPQFAEAYVSKQKTNGFNISMSLFINSGDYDLDAIEFRKAITSQDVIKMTLPLGQENELTLHCISAEEDWNLRQSRGVAVFNLELQTTFTDFLAPQTNINYDSAIFSQKTDAFTAMLNDLSNFRDKSLKKVQSLIEDVQEGMGKVNRVFNEAYQTENALISTADNLNSFVQNIATTEITNVNLVGQAFQAMMDLPKNIIASYDDDGEVFDDFNFEADNSETFEFLNSASIVGRASNASKYRVETITKNQLVSEINKIDQQYLDFQKKNEKRNIQDEKQAPTLSVYIPKNNTFTATDIMVQNTLKILDRRVFSLKRNISITTNRTRNLFSFVSELYDFSSGEELENMVDEIIKLNNISGKSLLFLKKGTKIMYLK